MFRVVLAVVLVATSLCCRQGRRFWYEDGSILRCDQEGHSCPALKGIHCDQYNMFYWKICCYDPRMTGNSENPQIRSTTLTPSTIPTTVLTRAPAISYERSRSRTQSLIAAKICRVEPKGRCSNETVCRKKSTCIGFYCCPNKFVETIEIDLRFKVAPTNSNLNEKSSQLDYPSKCPNSNTDPLRRNNQILWCSKHTRPSVCPAGYNCEQLRNGDSCCPKAFSQFSVDNKKCPIGDREAFLKKPTDCRTQNCPSGFQCTIIDSTKRRCCKNAYEPKVKVEPLLHGNYEMLTTGFYRNPSTSVLVSTTINKIVVDFGWPMDINSTLKNIGSKLKDVTYGVYTHSHLDHIGSISAFANVTILSPDGSFFRGHESWFSNLIKGKSVTIDPNVEVIPTPGHTATDVSVFVYNVPKLGTVVVSGDIISDRRAAIEQDNDAERCMNAFNCERLLRSRKLIICSANFVVPGHGNIFEITPLIRSKNEC